MANSISSEDHALIRDARYGEHAFLKDLDRSFFSPRTPVILNCCSDWRRRFEILRKHAEVRRIESNEDSLCHAFHWHGGPLRLDPRSPTNRIPRSHEVFTAEIVDAAVEVTTIEEVDLYFHWPCGKAFLHGMDVRQAFTSIVIVKKRLEHILPQRCRVRVFFHVDFGDLEPGGMRSYFVKTSGAKAWLHRRR